MPILSADSCTNYRLIHTQICIKFMSGFSEGVDEQNRPQNSPPRKAANDPDSYRRRLNCYGTVINDYRTAVYIRIVRA